MRTTVSAGCALVAFAANSVLCRLALGGTAIDAASFSVIRLASGAIALMPIAALAKRPGARLGGSWGAAAQLCLYAVAFSFAYLDLSAGAGAFILFGAVQATMSLAALSTGERPDVREWAGMLLALGGLGYLVSPGLEAPSLAGSLLMAIAGGCLGDVLAPWARCGRSTERHRRQLRARTAPGFRSRSAHVEATLPMWWVSIRTSVPMASESSSSPSLP